MAAGPTLRCGGILDDVTIWNRALSAAEIQTVMSGALPSNLSGLGAAWQLNEGSGQTVVDSSPHNRSGQLGGAPGTDAADPQWVGAPAGSRPDAIAPVVSLTAPANGTRVSGIVAVSATATDDSSVVGVQFFLDGTPLQPEDASAPYSLAWNTTAVANGPHTITARARDAAGNTTVSAAITISVSNAVSPPVISDVRASATAATSADILWASNLPTTGQVEYGTTTAYGRSTAPSAPATLHIDTLSGLTPGTKLGRLPRARDEFLRNICLHSAIYICHAATAAGKFAARAVSAARRRWRSGIDPQFRPYR